jgi:hypothetical protein
MTPTEFSAIILETSEQTAIPFQKRRITMKKIQPTVTVVLKAVALALAVANVVLGILNVVTVETHVTLLGLGLLALALAGVQKS